MVRRKPGTFGIRPGMLTASPPVTDRRFGTLDFYRNAAVGTTLIEREALDGQLANRHSSSTLAGPNVERSRQDPSHCCRRAENRALHQLAEDQGIYPRVRFRCARRGPVDRSGARLRFAEQTCWQRK